MMYEVYRFFWVNSFPKNFKVATFALKVEAIEYADWMTAQRTVSDGATYRVYEVLDRANLIHVGGEGK